MAATQSAQASTPPVPPAAPRVSAGAPTGAVGATVECCPSAIVFSNLGDNAISYYGFDDITHSADGPSSAYWVPPTKQKTASAGPNVRDGSVWVSVPPDGEIALGVLIFGSASCVENCQYDITPSTVAAVVEPKPKSASDKLKIRGLAEGEAILKVTCNGELRGYIRIWCRKIITLDVGMGVVEVSSRKYMEFDNLPLSTYLVANPSPPPSAGEMAALLNAAFRPALIQFTVQDYGSINYDAQPAPIRRQVQDYVFDGPVPIINRRGTVEMRQNTEAEAPYWLAALAELGKLNRQMVGGGKQYNIWFLPASNILGFASDIGKPDMAGAATGIPATDLFLFTLLSSIRDHIPHELGHIMGLRHPNDPGIGGQLPEHVLKSTDPASNISSSDPDNMMGYGPSQTNLVYAQWNALRSILTSADKPAS